MGSDSGGGVDADDFGDILYRVGAFAALVAFEVAQVFVIHIVVGVVEGVEFTFYGIGVGGVAFLQASARVENKLVVVISHTSLDNHHAVVYIAVHLLNIVDGANAVAGIIVDKIAVHGCGAVFLFGGEGAVLPVAVVGEVGATVLTVVDELCHILSR